MSTPLLWDVFCRVIDNHGDLGVCWRLSCQLADQGHRVRLWVDDDSALRWMAPQGHPEVQVCPWPEPDEPVPAPTMGRATDQTGTNITIATAGQVWLEAFGVDIPAQWIANYLYKESAIGQKSLKNPNPNPNPNHVPAAWINLEYLTAESYAQRCHGLPSPAMSGPAKGLTRHFFYPGFTAPTGGLLREPQLMERQARFDRVAWLQGLGVRWAGERVVSLFCYEPAALDGWLCQCAAGDEPTLWLVAPGRPWAAVQQALGRMANPAATPTGAVNGDLRGTLRGSLRIEALPHLSQTDFDHLLWASDLNFVRGEDSLVRALWAGKPLVWHIYPQGDGAHWPKLQAFLDWMQAPDDLQAFHHHWNADAPLGAPPNVDWAKAAACVQIARDRLLAQPDLVTQLLAFVTTTARAAAQ